MKVALTVWENRISPLFDSARMLLIVEISGDAATGRHYETFSYDSPLSRAAALSRLDVDTLICGAISDPFAKTIEGNDITIIPFIAGAVEEVLDAYLRDGLNDSRFQMPGCETRLDRVLS
ncbi:MAG: NifB/NifX family molybdenum-iron cluster-binding protein [Desulfatiglans sp.]|jgi:predicted Fe-Mo cluster-binding NifX family protein|nr:NifB/NifX family molybdenum-iron cluster-binding protein [Thermodesulfobacteriota bacterium]MEE4352790.1 NifB/NifX family molybdenum-iron cluster-binding protein [Desulfatiglans sp.]